MEIVKCTVINIVLFLISISVNGQVKDSKIRQDVLAKGVIDSLYIFGKWAAKGQSETHLKYLGIVKNKNGKIFKVINSSWFWGISKRATSRILIFNNRNKYVGNYYVNMVHDLPTKLRNGKLIFKNISNDCDNQVTTIIDLRNGLPKQFFRKCTNNDGDILSFGIE